MTPDMEVLAEHCMDSSYIVYGEDMLICTILPLRTKTQLLK